MDFYKAKQALDLVIRKSRVHLYKPIQLAEVLHRDRVVGDIDLLNLETYRTPSRKWRDLICIDLLGRTSTSSARYQDDVFNSNAVPPQALFALSEVNRQTSGGVEAYIYRKFIDKISQLTSGLEYVSVSDRHAFELAEFISLFWHEPGLRRSLDKVYETVVYSLFQAIVEAIELKVQISYNAGRTDLLTEFSDFSKRVLNLEPGESTIEMLARFFRNGVANAADRGLDLWANFGLAVQIKHLSLTQPMAADIVGNMQADRIVIVCKSAEQPVIESILLQIGWGQRIQAILTEIDLENWYTKALKGAFGATIGPRVLELLRNELQIEFPSSDRMQFDAFWQRRAYHMALSIDKEI